MNNSLRISRKSTILVLSVFVLLIFSCDSYNKITYARLDKNGADKEKKQVSIATIKDSTIIFEEDIRQNKQAENSLVSSLENNIKTFDSKGYPINLSLKLPEKIRLVQHELKQTKSNKEHQKENDLKKMDGDDSTALKIFLIVLLIFLFIVLTIFLIILFAFNAAVNDNNSSCYVATMAYGDINAPEVKTLRSFRDQYLQNTMLGKKFITWYYKHSPGFVEKHSSKIWLHRSFRFGLNILVSFLRFFYKLK